MLTLPHESSRFLVQSAVVIRIANGRAIATFNAKLPLELPAISLDEHRMDSIIYLQTYRHGPNKSLAPSLRSIGRPVKKVLDEPENRCKGSDNQSNVGSGESIVPLDSVVGNSDTNSRKCKLSTHEQRSLETWVSLLGGPQASVGFAASVLTEAVAIEGGKYYLSLLSNRFETSTENQPVAAEFVTIHLVMPSTYPYDR